MLNKLREELEKANKKHGPYCCIGDGYYAIREELSELEAEIFLQHNKHNMQRIEEEALHLAVTALKMADLAHKTFERNKRRWKGEAV